MASILPGRLRRPSTPTLSQWKLGTADAAVTVSWCKDQMNSCAELCVGPGLDLNSCDHMTLNYACTCDNGTAPGLSYYMRTMPTFICEQNNKDCIEDAKGDAAAEKECGDSSPSRCGTLDPMSANKEPDDSKDTPTSATTGTETTSTATSTSKPASTDSGSPSSGGGGKPSWGWMAAVVAGILAFVGALAGGFYWLGKRRSRNKKRKSMMMMGDGIGNDGHDDDRMRPYKKLHEDQGGSQWSVHEVHRSKEVPVEMDSSHPSPMMLSELPSPNASHFVAELDGCMLPTVTVSKLATTHNQDDGQKYRMPRQG
ncbi:PCI domain-containing protein [Apiospora phragmitis]|uniref:PCI domain-containing protein n=1 Tax=Apiospora phragmitis TaxID=2905665 RepID=A0ABR1UUC4_9PEZI